MIHSYHLILAYDGTPYFGWQRTASGPSIQETLQKALWNLSQEALEPEAASRTDRGVHAEGQSIHFFLKKEFPPHRLQQGLNALLPPEIRVVKASFAPPTFHPTLDATHKEYRYRLCLGPVQEPIYRLYSWHLYRHFHTPLNLSAIEAAIPHLLGHHDFSALANEPEENPFCTLLSLTCHPLPDERLEFRMTGDRFLYKMARNLVGTLTSVGCGKIEPEAISPLLASRDRRRAGVTAPAHGLSLHQVFYREEI